MLTFEASGALKDASLVMRDRETDSWWGLMEEEAIDGEMKGTPFVPIPYSKKTTWAKWVAEHPETVVLSVDGKTHEPKDGYAGYFASPETYRDIEIEDRRMAPKTPIFVFQDKKGEPIVVKHESMEGLLTFAPEFGTEPDTPQVFLFRKRGQPMLESTVAYWFPLEFVFDPLGTPKSLRDRIESLLGKPEEAERAGVSRVVGYDTYWYTWAAHNPGARIEPQPRQSN